MPARNMPDDNSPDILVLGKMDDIRLIMSEKHNKILRLVLNNELTISDLARSLAMNPGSVYYYLKDLEKHGLVRQVREEINGGVVKKYYRAAARRIALELPEFDSRNVPKGFPEPDRFRRLIHSIEHLGYRLPPENAEDASDLLARYEKRMIALMTELQKAGLEEIEEDGIILENTNNLVLGYRMMNDPEMNRIFSGFGKLFLKIK